MASVTQGIEALPLTGASAEQRLRRPPPVPSGADAPATRQVLRALRGFHGGDTEAAASLTPPGDDLVPALLFPFRDPARVRIDYPLFLRGSEGDAADDDRSFLPLADLFAQQLEITAPSPDDARILKDNLARLERSVRTALAGTNAPVATAPLLEHAAKEMLDELGLKPGAAAALRADLTRLIESVPPGGRLLPLGEDATLHLLVAVARDAGRARRAALRDAVLRARTRLRDYLRLERSKDVSGSSSDALRGAIGSTGAARLDTDALARLLGSRRSAAPADGSLRDVIESDGGVLDGFLATGPSPLLTVIGADPELATADEEVNWQSVEREDVCRAAAEAFDTQAAAYAELFAALRTARLLEEGNYDAARHARLRATFDWRSFTREEVLALPPVVAIESASHLAGPGMVDCSRLLLSGRPAEVLVRVQPATNPAVDDDDVTGYRFELAYLGISHREVLVHQSSAARPAHLAAGFRRSLGAATGSIHVVTSGLSADGEAARLGAWIHAGAALGARAHPFIHYDPEAGATWARRLDLGGNPQPEADWPIYELALAETAAAGGGGNTTNIPVAFTFADFLLLEPRFRSHFRVIPDEVPESELMPLAEHLALGPEERSRIPFVWAADAEGCARRLVVDDAVERACRDRLDYWRTLQELAGIRNEHVREAVEGERARLEAAFEEERVRLEGAHAAEMAQVRQDEARAVLQRLAQSLLGTDVESLAASVVAPTEGPSAGSADSNRPPDGAINPFHEPSAGAAADQVRREAHQSASRHEAPPEAIAAQADDEVDEEPWIDSALCTSCNDCLDINPQVFVYNANKQAIIGDARAGTYAQLVQAAEKCPARCIHPGRPLHPDEAGLDALIERAKPFNV